MIITRTPFRISFFGGGTDYPVYYGDHGGAVLSCTINKYCYVTCRWLPPFFDHRFRLRYRLREEVQEVGEIQHPSVRESLRHLGIDSGIEMVHTSDIPAMSGIGSSSAFTVGFLHALYALQGRMVTKRQLAFDAIHVEQELIGEHVGSQDQVAAAFGGLNRITFGGVNHIMVEPVCVTAEKLQTLQDSLMFFFTGFSRIAETIAKTQIEETPRRIGELDTMKGMVEDAISILNGPCDQLDDFGKLLHESWTLKRSLTTKISSPEIDDIYLAARRAGAVGGKICGAGGGGFMLLYVPKERQAAVKEALRGLLHVPFRLENLGSHVAFYST